MGFGRFGEHFWGFEQQGVVPDIVTMGKPFGNGMPIGAVVCQRHVAESFDNGLEYFNTFGGNPVCAAAALAVLDVLRDEQLPRRAGATGDYLCARLWELAAEPAGRLVGDVRGRGLFVGVELVRDRATLEPASAETSRACSRLKDEYNVLTSVDGPHDSVIVIKPPMVFSERDVDTFVGALRTVLSTLGEVDPAAKHTPT